MNTIDLGTPPPPPAHSLDSMPRRASLTLAELRHACELAGGAPMPFDVAAPAEASSLDSKLGASPASVDEDAYQRALGSLADPETHLTRRGLLVDGVLDDGLAGALGLLATPEVALDIDVAVEDIRVKSWQRQAAGAVATLATSDGVVFELSWFPTAAWPDELGRMAILPEDLDLTTSKAPTDVDLPYHLADGALEAARAGRDDLVPVLTAQSDALVLDADGEPLSTAEISQVIDAFSSEARGRLRAMVAYVGDAQPSVVGVRSWVLVNDGWRALHPHRADDEPRVRVRAVDPAELAADLAPVLSEVVR